MPNYGPVMYAIPSDFNPWPEAEPHPGQADPLRVYLDPNPILKTALDLLTAEVKALAAQVAALAEGLKKKPARKRRKARG